MKRALALSILLALILTVGCSRKGKPAEFRGQADAGSAFQMALVMDPSPAKNHEDTTFRLRLTDGQGKSVSGADVKAALIMPEMDMGKNEFALSPRADGSYEGSGKFNMAGNWHVVITATKGGSTAKTTFTVPVEL